MKDITFRRAKSEDAEILWDLRKQAIFSGCINHYSSKFIESWISAPVPEKFGVFVETEIFYVAEKQSQVIGFAGLRLSVPEINAVFVSPEVAGKGLGKILVKKLESVAKEKGISALTLSSSLNAVPFYSACGYIEGVAGVQPTTGGIQIPCIFMEKRLE